MKKTYLIKPPETPRANTVRRVLNTAPIEDQLARTSEGFNCAQLPEPELLFSGNRRCVDPRTGLMAYGPHWKGSREKRLQVRVGIVGTSEGIEKTLKLLEEISKPIEQDPNIDCILHPSFPGLNSGLPFEIEIVTLPTWHRPIYARDLSQIVNCEDSGIKPGLPQACFSGEVRALSELDIPPDVVICSIPQDVERQLLSRGQQESYKCRFQSGLKAASLDFLPTELLWADSHSPAARRKDLATQAWNLSVALLYKAGLIPWFPADAPEDTCYAGISSFHATGSDSPHSRTIFAQVFTNLGQSLILKSDTCQPNPEDTGKGPHLTNDQATKLASQILEAYTKQVGDLPRKVVIQKTSPYTRAERQGFENLFGKIDKYGLVTLTRRGIFCLRPGEKTISRGTAVQFGEKLGLIYASGYVPFLRSHVGFKMPQPLEIAENWGTLSFQEAAADVLKLTKLNRNTPAFCLEDPITLAQMNDIGEILQIAGNLCPASDPRFYL